MPWATSFYCRTTFINLQVHWLERSGRASWLVSAAKCTRAPWPRCCPQSSVTLAEQQRVARRPRFPPGFPVTAARPSFDALSRLLSPLCLRPSCESGNPLLCLGILSVQARNGFLGFFLPCPSSPRPPASRAGDRARQFPKSAGGVHSKGALRAGRCKILERKGKIGDRSFHCARRLLDSDPKSPVF